MFLSATWHLVVIIRFMILWLQNRAANPLHIDMRLNIELIDVNDEMPLFGGLDENGRYSGSIAENLEAGAEFITVTATDKDEFPDFRKVSDWHQAFV